MIGLHIMVWELNFSLKKIPEMKEISKRILLELNAAKIRVEKIV